MGSNPTDSTIHPLSFSGDFLSHSPVWEILFFWQPFGNHLNRSDYGSKNNALINERFFGKGEVACSNHASSTIFPVSFNAIK